MDKDKVEFLTMALLHGMREPLTVGLGTQLSITKKSGEYVVRRGDRDCVLATAEDAAKILLLCLQETKY